MTILRIGTVRADGVCENLFCSWRDFRGGECLVFTINSDGRELILTMDR